MSGYETAKAIRGKEKRLNATVEMPIIALTGHGAVDVQAFCVEAGMQGILSKPLSLEQAEILWKHFKVDASIPVPGLTLLKHK
jgi:CheY-like chemotaxis protein